MNVLQAAEVAYNKGAACSNLVIFPKYWNNSPSVSSLIQIGFLMAFLPERKSEPEKCSETRLNTFIHQLKKPWYMPGFLVSVCKDRKSVLVKKSGIRNQIPWIPWRKRRIMPWKASGHKTGRSLLKGKPRMRACSLQKHDRTNSWGELVFPYSVFNGLKPYYKG